jgi:hypothetical protein
MQTEEGKLDMIKKMHISVRKYIIHIVYLVHVSAIHVAIFREVHAKYRYFEILQKF